MALKKETREILNREELIEKRNLWFERMRHVFDGTASGWNAEYVFGVNGIAAFSERDMVKEPEKWMEDCLENLAAQYEAAGFLLPRALYYDKIIKKEGDGCGQASDMDVFTFCS